MAAKPDKTSTSFLSRTVKNIKKHRKSKHFIRVEKNETQEIEWKRRKPRKDKNVQKTAMIYVAHLPEGFYEYQLRKYFNQFGKVTNVRLERSKKTGRSKGYAFVEFKSPEVAKIAAETMNNYIMFNRILKAEFVTRKYNRKEFWEKKVDAKHYPRRKAIEENVRATNKPCSELKEKSRLRRRITRLDEMIQRLKEKGINYSYKPAIRREIADSPSADGKYIRLKTDTPVLEEDEIRREIADSPSADGKYIRLKTDTPVLEEDESDVPVLEIDESDKEIEFMTPPNVIKKKLLVLDGQKSPLKKPKKIKQGKIKKGKRENIAKKIIRSANEQEIQKCTPVKQEQIPNEKSEFQIKNVTPEVTKRNNKKQNTQFSQKLKSLSQEKGSKKQRNSKKNKTK